MKGLIKLFLIGITLIPFLNSIAGQSGAVCYDFQDTTFIKNYIAADKISYLYATPNLNSKTKIRIPKNVMITTINKSAILNMENSVFLRPKVLKDGFSYQI